MATVLGVSALFHLIYIQNNFNMLVYTRGSQTGAHLPIRRATFKVISRKGKILSYNIYCQIFIHMPANIIFNGHFTLIAKYIND